MTVHSFPSNESIETEPSVFVPHAGVPVTALAARISAASEIAAPPVIEQVRAKNRRWRIVAMILSCEPSVNSVVLVGDSSSPGRKGGRSYDIVT